MKLFGALWSHPMLALRTTTVITYLNNLSCGNLATYTKVRLLILKLVYYVWIVQMSVRAVVVVQQDLTKEKVLAAFLPFNPMIVMLVRLFGSASLNASILSSFCLAGQGVIHLDYVFTALIKVPNLFGLIHFIVIGNGLHFEAFNARRLGGWPKPASTRPFWQLWRLPVDYVFLGSRIWRATAKTAAAAAPNTLAKNSTPAIAFKTFSQSVSRDNKLFPSTSTSSATSLRFSSLPPLISGSIYLSDSLRALVYVYSAAWEALTTIGITLALLIAAYFYVVIAGRLYNNQYDVQLQANGNETGHFCCYSSFLVLLLYAWALVDLFAVVYHIWNVIRLTAFGAHLILVFSFLVHGQIECELNRALRENLRLREAADSHLSGFKSNRVRHFQPSLAVLQLQLLLHRFYREYRWLLASMGLFNDCFVSRTLLTNGLTNLVINLVFVGNLLFRQNRLAFAMAAFMVLIIVAQVLIVGTIATGLTTISNGFYRSDRLLYQAQLSMTVFPPRQDCFRSKNSNESDRQQNFCWRRQTAAATTVLAKLKLAVFYETVCTKNKFRFTVGSYTDISYRSMFEFLFVYTGFLMYVAKMIRKGQL